MTRLATAIEAAIEAGEALRRKLTQARSVKSKGLRDIVTDADFAAQHVILEHIRSAFPGDSILAEEGLHDADLSASTPTWVIDPLDGTSNYARQIPMFGVSIGLIADGQVQVGVIYDPLRRELYYAERDQGAFLRAGRGRPRRLAVSGIAALGDAVIGTGWPREGDRRELSARLLPRVGMECHTLRLTGSAALTIAYVAAGRLDGSFYLALAPWDVAAGALMIVEAGGQLSALDSTPWRVEAPQVIASNGHLHGALARALA